MKEQDARVENVPEHQLVLYVEQEDGSYGPIQTGSFMMKNYFDDYLEKHEKLEQNYRTKWCNGEISSVGYYMVLINISAADLGRRIGLSARKVKKHMDPKHFANARMSMVRRYAEVFGVPVANMFQILASKTPDGKIKQEKTGNPMVVITHV